MFRSRYLWGLMLCIQIGCARRHQAAAPVPVMPAPFQQFVSQKFDWSTVRRVVLLPLANQSPYEHATVELQTNLAAEFQRAGHFDVVVAQRDPIGCCARDIFASGQFDEIEMLKLAREYNAQAVMVGLITQYHPYAPPRVGLSLLMISPAEGIAIASADGLWDAREEATAQQAQAYQRIALSWKQGLMGLDRVLDSPDVYQRFVCQQIAASLHPNNNGMGMPIDSVFPGSMMPTEMILPAAATEPIPPPPAPPESSLPPLNSSP